MYEKNQFQGSKNSLFRH